MNGTSAGPTRHSGAPGIQFDDEGKDTVTASDKCCQCESISVQADGKSIA